MLSVGDYQRRLQPLPPGLHTLDCCLCRRSTADFKTQAGWVLFGCLHLRSLSDHCHARHYLLPLGRMLGDVGGTTGKSLSDLSCYGALMLGIEKFSMSGSMLSRLKLKGIAGAFILGLAYGVLSGSCTFGFISPILAIIIIQQKIAIGVLFILLFAVGHCLPIVVAGSSAAAVKKVLENSRWQSASDWFRKKEQARLSVCWVYILSLTRFLLFEGICEKTGTF